MSSAWALTWSNHSHRPHGPTQATLRERSTFHHYPTRNAHHTAWRSLRGTTLDISLRCPSDHLTRSPLPLSPTAYRYITLMIARDNVYSVVLRIDRSYTSAAVVVIPRLLLNPFCFIGTSVFIISINIYKNEINYENLQKCPSLNSQ